MTTGAFVANPGVGGDTFSADLVGVERVPYSKLDIGADGVSSPVNAANPLPVTIGDVVHQTDQPFANGDYGILALAKRRDSDTTSVSSDGDYTTLNMDEYGRLKVAAAPAGQAPTTGNITGAAQSVVADVSRTSNITIYCTGTFAGSNCTFEGSLDGTNYFGVQAIRTNANTIELTTGVLAAAPAYAWELSVNGLTNFRVRSTAFTSGTQTWRIQPAPYATEPIPGAQISGTQPVSGTVTANIGTGSIAAGTNAIGDVGVQYRASATGGATPASILAPATPAAAAIKASGGRLVGLILTNSAASLRSMKFWNTAVAGVTMGTTAALFEIDIPAGQSIPISLPGGISFSTAITWAVTGAKGLTDNTAITANDVTGVALYA